MGRVSVEKIDRLLRTLSPIFNGMGRSRDHETHSLLASAPLIRGNSLGWVLLERLATNLNRLTAPSIGVSVDHAIEVCASLVFAYASGPRTTTTAILGCQRAWLQAEGQTCSVRRQARSHRLI